MNLSKIEFYFIWNILSIPTNCIKLVSTFAVIFNNHLLKGE